MAPSGARYWMSVEINVFRCPNALLIVKPEDASIFPWQNYFAICVFVRGDEFRNHFSVYCPQIRNGKKLYQYELHSNHKIIAEMLSKHISEHNVRPDQPLSLI